MLHSLLAATALFSGAIATSAYAPTSATCPSSLVRLGTSLSTSESTWKTARKTLADTSLRSWLTSTNPAFTTTAQLPTLGLSISGGGYRAFLTGAGVIQGLDSADSNVSTSGLYQSIAYMSALSGGSWLLSSLADHDFPTVSSLLASQWSDTFSQGLLDPYGLLTAVAYAQIIADFGAKEAAGFQTSLSDIWARLLSWQMLNGSDGGVASTLSGITSKSAFTSHSIPYPIITALNADVQSGSCVPGANSSVWELTPYETGSWGAEINAFTPSKYLGTAVTNGKPNGTCINGFDNLGFVLGTSSNVFNDVGAIYASLGDVVSTICAASIGDTSNSVLGDIISSLITIFPSITAGLTDVVDALYALYPNPFYGLTTASQVSSLQTLHMVDGGESGQTSPIFPHLLPARNVSLLIINDNNGDTSTSTPAYPNGTAIYNSYLAAKAAGLTRMPTVPSPSSYLSNYTSGAPIFFGCKDASKVTLVWVPNTDVSYASGIATFSLSESKAVSSAMIENGKGVISRGDSAAWAECLGCAILDAGGLAVPSLCAACFEQYCYAG